MSSKLDLKEIDKEIKELARTQGRSLDFALYAGMHGHNVFSWYVWLSHTKDLIESVSNIDIESYNTYDLVGLVVPDSMDVLLEEVHKFLRTMEKR